MSPRSLALTLIGQVKGQRKSIEETCRTHQQFAHMDPRDQSLTRALITHFFRHHMALDAAFAPLLSRPLETLSPAALGPLRLGVVELLVMGSEPHAALNECVKLAPKALKGLVNAVLRKLVADPQAKARFNAGEGVPEWMVEKWAEDFGTERAEEIWRSLRTLPAMDLSLKPGTALDLGEELLPGHRRVPAGDPRTLPGFEAGDWWVQDMAASLPARLLGDVSGLKVLDICAAPGGKTLQLAAQGAHVTALDNSMQRLKRLSENLERTNLSAEIVCEDARTYTPDQQFDAILLDAPCSASGTLRRHPEWPWIHARKDQLKNVPLQGELIDKAMSLLKPGGRLVYAVCSLFMEEGEAHFANREGRVPTKPDGCPDWAWDTKKGWLRTTPNQNQNCDGFFAAVLKKAD